MGQKVTILNIFLENAKSSVEIKGLPLGQVSLPIRYLKRGSLLIKEGAEYGLITI